MAASSKITVTDRKGVVVGTWTRKTFVVKSGQSIDRNASGQYLFNGQLLALTTQQVDALKIKGRVKVEG